MGRCSPVIRRSRSKSRATMKQAAQSITSRAPAKAAASPKLGVMTWNDMSEVSATGGRLARTLSCCATRVSDVRAEIARPAQIAQAASSGMKTTAAGNWGAFHTALATSGLAAS